MLDYAFDKLISHKSIFEEHLPFINIYYHERIFTLLCVFAYLFNSTQLTTSDDDEQDDKCDERLRQLKEPTNDTKDWHGFDAHNDAMHANNEPPNGIHVDNNRMYSQAAGDGQTTEQIARRIEYAGDNDTDDDEDDGADDVNDRSDVIEMSTLHAANAANQQRSTETLLDIAANESAMDILKFVNNGINASTNENEHIELSSGTNVKVDLIELFKSSDNDDDDDESNNGSDNETSSQIESQLELIPALEIVINSDENDLNMNMNTEWNLNNNDCHFGDNANAIIDNNAEAAADMIECVANAEQNIVNTTGYADETIITTEEFPAKDDREPSQEVVEESGNDEPIEIITKPSVTFYCTDLSNLRENSMDADMDTAGSTVYMNSDDDNVPDIE